MEFLIAIGANSFGDTFFVLGVEDPNCILVQRDAGSSSPYEP